MERARDSHRGSAETDTLGGTSGAGASSALQQDGGIGPLPFGFGYQVTYNPSEDFGYLSLADGHPDYSVNFGSVVLDFSREKGLVGIEFAGLSEEARAFFGL